MCVCCVCVCVHVCGHACACVCLCTCTGMHSPQHGVGAKEQHCVSVGACRPFVWDRASFVYHGCVHQVSWLESVCGFPCLPSCQRITDIAHVHSHFRLHVTSGDSNSCPSTFTARAFITGPPPALRLPYCRGAHQTFPILAFGAQLHWHLAISGPMCLWWTHSLCCVFLWPLGYPFSASLSSSLSPK